MNWQLNADLGEGVGTDSELMPLIDLACIATGVYAGDATITRDTLRLAATHNKAVAVHPGYPDREQFGRVETGLSAEAIHAHLLMQVGGFLTLARTMPVRVTHIKPHGALYHRAHADPTVAKAVVSVAILTGLGLVGLPNSLLATHAEGLQVPYLREAFADRRSDANGGLVPRSEPGAMIESPHEAFAALQARNDFDTVCVHGDTPGALAFLRQFRELIA